MTILTSIILVVAISIVASIIAYNVQMGTKPLSQFKLDFDNEQIEEVGDELYNKQLRPVAPKVPAKTKEVTSQDITPQIIDKVVRIAKAAPQMGTVNIDSIVEQIKKDNPTKSQLPIDKPKSKRKYYPRKNK
jgi:hypothetical protein